MAEVDAAGLQSLGLDNDGQLLAVGGQLQLCLAAGVADYNAFKSARPIVIERPS